MKLKKVNFSILVISIFFLLGSGSMILNAGLVDLAVVAGDIKVNNDCKVEITVHNLGSSAVPKGKPLGISVQFVQNNKGAGGWSFNWPIKNELPPGGKLSFTVHQKKVQGTMSVRVTVDKYRRFHESNENNNYAVRTVTCGTPPKPPSAPKVLKQTLPNPRIGLNRKVKKLPDLWVEILSVPKKNVSNKTTDLLLFYIKVRNVGDAWTPRPADIKAELYRVNRINRIYPSSLVTAFYTVPKIRNGGWKFLKFHLRLKEKVAGTHYIRITVNYNRKIVEKSTNNNTAKRSFTIF